MKKLLLVTFGMLVLMAGTMTGPAVTVAQAGTIVEGNPKDGYNPCQCICWKVGDKKWCICVCES